MFLQILLFWAIKSLYYEVIASDLCNFINHPHDLRRTVSDSGAPPPCNCTFRIDPEIELEVLRINCGDNAGINVTGPERIPSDVIILDMSFNLFRIIPVISSDNLKIFDISHNIIDRIDGNDTFEHIKNIRQLDLSSNRITTISKDAFTGLNSLKELNLSGNLMSLLTINLFSPLHALQKLSLARNPNLKEQLNDEQFNMYDDLGLSLHVETLDLSEIGLNQIFLSNGVSLKELFLNYNNFTVIPPNLPETLVTLSLSGNPIIELTDSCIPNLINLEVLELQDMGNLTKIHQYSLGHLIHLKSVHFDGSSKLNYISPNAFDDKTHENRSIDLENLTFKGAALRTIDLPIGNVTHFDLTGNPITCNCSVKWIVEMDTETNGKCYLPKNLKGRLLSAIGTAQLQCRRWPKIVYDILNGLLILLLLTICAVVIYLIVMGLRPSKRRTKYHSVIDASSPYARNSTLIRTS